MRINQKFKPFDFHFYAVSKNTIRMSINLYLINAASEKYFYKSFEYLAYLPSKGETAVSLKLVKVFPNYKMGVK